MDGSKLVPCQVLISGNRGRNDVACTNEEIIDFVFVCVDRDELRYRLAMFTLVLGVNLRPSPQDNLF